MCVVGWDDVCVWLNDSGRCDAVRVVCRMEWIGVAGMSATQGDDGVDGQDLLAGCSWVVDWLAGWLAGRLAAGWAGPLATGRGLQAAGAGHDRMTGVVVH